MHVIVNDEQKTIAEHCNLAEALQQWGYQMDMPIAVALNHRLVHKQHYATTELTANVFIEILLPMQGG